MEDSCLTSPRATAFNDWPFGSSCLFKLIFLLGLLFCKYSCLAAIFAYFVPSGIGLDYNRYK